MKISKIYILLLLMVGLSFAASICFYPHLPEQMASHWSTSAEPDGFMPKAAGAFLVPGILAIVTLIQAAVLYGVLSQCNNKLIQLCVSIYVLAFTAFLVFTHLAVLLYNVGVGVNVPLCVFSGLAVLIVAPSILVAVAVCKSKRMAIESARLDVASTSQTTYSDKLIEIAASSITFYSYYFPMGNKTVDLSEIEYIRVLTGGSLRLHGSDDFRTWWPADYNRMSRDRRFVVHLRNKWRRIGFTVEDSAMVAGVLKNKGLLQEPLQEF